MAIIKSPLARAASYAKGVFGKAVSTVKSVFGGTSNAAIGVSGLNGVLSATSTPKATAPVVKQNGGASGSWGAPVSSTNLGTQTYGGAGILPQVNAGGSSSSIGTYAPSPIYSAPITLLGGKSPSGSTSTSTSTLDFAPTYADSSPTISVSSLTAPTSPISTPTAPTYANPGQINNAGFANSMTTVDPVTNMVGAVQPTQDTADTTETKKRNAIMESLYKLIPQKENVSEDPQVKAQQEELNRRKQEVANYTAQLNTVVAQQNADLLRLRGIGSQEGVTETVYGGQAATINREAAIKALPIQAQLAAAQGNQQLAQDYLTQLTTWKTEQINSDYDYRKNLYASISDYVKGELKNKLDEKNKMNDRAYELSLKNIEYQHTLASKAIEKGVPGLISKINAVNPASPTFEQEIARVAGGILAPAGPGTGNNQMTDNERALMTQFRGEPIVKDFNDILAQKGTIDAYIQSGTGGPADLALVFSFMKGLDPTSVVRESEYDNAAKSGNIFQGAFAKFNGYFKAKGGQLPENVKEEFQNLVNLKLQVKEKQYNNVKTQYEALAGRQGLNPQNVVIDYAAGGNMGTVKKGNLSDQAFVEQALSSQGINYNEVVDGTPSGSMPVLDNATGQPGYIPVREFNPNKYTRI